MQIFVHDVDDCRDLIAIPPGKEHGRDPTRETSTIIQSIRIECWATLQANPEARLTSATLTDRIAPEMIQHIMANSFRLATSDEECSKVLIKFSGGELVCKNAWRCRLSLPDGRSPPEQSLDFEVIFALGDETFIIVTQMIHGRSGFVYGIHWHHSPGGGEVVAIFPDILQ